MFDQTIKNIFNNSVGFNTAEIVVEANGQLLSLFYHLSDNPVQHIWQQIHSSSDSFKMGVCAGMPLGELVKEINDLLLSTGRPQLSWPIQQDQLNQIHHSFVSIPLPHSEADSKINALIHAIESKGSIMNDYDATTKFYKDPDAAIPIKEEYKLWLSNELDWGHLFAGFATIGKSWKDIAKTNDDIEDLKIQSLITSETVMMFNADYPYRKASECMLYNWAKTSPHSVPLDNLNQLSFGSYFLGQIIITDVFLKFHPIASDWYVPNHKCKMHWNKTVMGHKAKVKQIKFSNSDLYFDTLLQHTGLNHG